MPVCVSVATSTHWLSGCVAEAGRRTSRSSPPQSIGPDFLHTLYIVSSSVSYIVSNRIVWYRGIFYRGQMVSWYCVLGHQNDVQEFVSESTQRFETCSLRRPYHQGPTITRYHDTMIHISTYNRRQTKDDRYTTLHNTTQHNTIQHNTTQLNSTQHNSTQHNIT